MPRSHALTYEALNRAANRVLHLILAQRGRGEEPVALLLKQGAPRMAASLKVLKADKIYAPLAPSFGSRRISRSLAD